MAADRSGADEQVIEEQVTEEPADTPRPDGPALLNVLLLGLVLLLACGCVALGVLAFQARQDRAAEREEQERYGAVQRAATAQAEAFVNIDYRNADESIDKVAAGATGEFRTQYDSAAGGLAELMTQEKSVMTGDVLWAGVVDADPDSATVIVATTGTVANVSTKEKPVARNFRLQLELVLEGGRWLTSDLQFVAVTL